MALRNVVACRGVGRAGEGRLYIIEGTESAGEEHERYTAGVQGASTVLADFGRWHVLRWMA